MWNASQTLLMSVTKMQQRHCKMHPRRFIYHNICLDKTNSYLWLLLMTSFSAHKGSDQDFFWKILFIFGVTSTLFQCYVKKYIIFVQEQRYHNLKWGKLTYCFFDRKYRPGTEDFHISSQFCSWLRTSSIKYSQTYVQSMYAADFHWFWLRSGTLVEI